MKELYLVTVFGETVSYFEEYYNEEEVETIKRFFNDMNKHEVARYDLPDIVFEKKFVLYYQEKIIAAITNCTDIKILQYLEKFNRLWIEKNTKNFGMNIKSAFFDGVYKNFYMIVFLEKFKIP